MNFDAWWATLTDKEQNVIGLNNARFVWNAAALAFAKECEQQAEFALQAGNPQCSWRITVMGTKVTADIT